MKKGLIILFFSFIGFDAVAQIEFKVNSAIIFFDVFNVSIEYVVNDNWGAEVDFLLIDKSSGARLTGKYYTGPKIGGDKLYFDFFLQAFSDSAGGGFGMGYKFINNSGHMFEIGVGSGRQGGERNESFAYGKLSFGYRF